MNHFIAALLEQDNAELDLESHSSEAIEVSREEPQHLAVTTMESAPRNLMRTDDGFIAIEPMTECEWSQSGDVSAANSSQLYHRVNC
jgi:hypothetical protein